ncbi:unnamed protein product [Lactuca saligna]|uniref:OPA3-like protein n=1 Tax=Lactuca saligna TaxID=75948 RepID=A0AA35Y608_LACSI|nr:unnamed protein product [Lactuca saligna]
MILPFAKLGTLALKTICKPIAKRIKKEAGRHPQFRHAIINFAQANHRFRTKLQRHIYGHAIDAAIRPLNEEKAVQAAADLLGELFVFTVAGTAVILEVQRSSKSEARKEALRRQELETLRQRDEDLAKQIEMLKYKLDEIEQVAKQQGLVLKFRKTHPIEDGKASESGLPNSPLRPGTSYRFAVYRIGVRRRTKSIWNGSGIGIEAYLFGLGTGAESGIVVYQSMLGKGPIDLQFAYGTMNFVNRFNWDVDWDAKSVPTFNLAGINETLGKSRKSPRSPTKSSVPSYQIYGYKI